MVLFPVFRVCIPLSLSPGRHSKASTEAGAAAASEEAEADEAERAAQDAAATAAAASDAQEKERLEKVIRVLGTNLARFSRRVLHGDCFLNIASKKLS